jgi:hypothetical protein
MNDELDNRGSKAKRVWRLLPLAAMLALSLVGMGARAASAATSQPFMASVSGTVVLSGLNKNDTIMLSGTGSASPLGQLQSYTANGVITSSHTDKQGTTYITDTLHETLTAANGDTLTILCQQTAVSDTTGFHGNDSWTVTGGTGRFSGATGSGTGHTQSVVAGTFTKDMTGTIAY